MNQEVLRLSKKLETILDKLDENQRYIIGVSGVPGSGKTTFVNKFVEDFNKHHPGDTVVAISMDGFHLPKAALDKMSNREEAYLRRGVHWTFDPEGIIQLIKSLKADTTKTIMAPTFDHKIGDPVKDGICIKPNHRIVIIEGIYLHLKSPEPWEQIPLLLDEKWFIPVDLEEARRRVGNRHYESGIEKSVEDGIKRYNNNDLLNAEFILKNRYTDAEDININLQ
ncbi:P-loop containing nucleoside triphosphate hydrolase protein [Mycotypha africana]|uniref:P-loop containing nucleoside triphosphate hydrolase protein n=1 Tax=Mycotypha africana TaxID=64632 RepID=UPI002300A9BD|nr:P-loop containing nucleoside triphosphate hydrolase protein [Mycotypha africana]KAI8970245.1 P-loop containing nucleoside triphosphate hydrolase protein [Mycotypha africana]